MAIYVYGVSIVFWLSFGPSSIFVCFVYVLMFSIVDLGLMPLLAWVAVGKPFIRQRSTNHDPSWCVRGRDHRTITHCATANPAFRDSYAMQLDVSLDAFDDEQKSTIVGLIEYSPSWQYSAMHIRTSAEDAQIEFWMADGVPKQSIWFFDIQSYVPLRDARESTDYFIARLRHACFNLLKADVSQHLLGDLLELPPHISPAALSKATLVLTLPATVVVALQSETLSSLAVPSIYWDTDDPPPRWLHNEFGYDIRDEFASTCPPPPSHPVETFQLQEVNLLNDFLRSIAPSLSPEDNSNMQLWLASLDKAWDELIDAGLHFRSKSKNKRPYAELIEFILLSTHLKDASELRMILRDASKLILPPSTHSLVESMLATKRVPDKAEISRTKLYMDVGLMLYMRLQNSLPRPPYCRSLAWDSSPQGGRDYELAVVRSIMTTNLVPIFEAMYVLFHHWDDKPWLLGPEEVERKRQEEEVIMKGIRRDIETHALPATGVGFGASGFASKVKSLMHACRLEQFTNKMLDIYIRELSTNVNDYGTERALNRMLPTALDVLCPFFKDTLASDVAIMKSAAGSATPAPAAAAAAGQANAQVEVEVRADNADVFEEVDEEVERDDDIFEDVPGLINGHDPDSHPENDGKCDISHMLEVPPMHHINDSAAKGLGQVMPSFDKTVHGAKQVCKIVRRRTYQAKLLARCFSGPIGSQYCGQLKSFRGHIHLERWGTWAFSMPELIRIEFIFRWGWDMNTFLRGDGNGLAAKEETKTLVNDVNEFATSPFYWAMTRVLNVLAFFMQRAEMFVESCPCHRNLLADRAVPPEVLKMLKSSWQDLPAHINIHTYI
jgi:hypothetical protein